MKILFTENFFGGGENIRNTNKILRADKIAINVGI
jgi:hypothetical protein